MARLVWPPQQKRLPISSDSAARRAGPVQAEKGDFQLADGKRRRGALVEQVAAENEVDLLGFFAAFSAVRSACGAPSRFRPFPSFLRRNKGRVRSSQSGAERPSASILPTVEAVCEM